jgi:hypothetical protein
MKIIEQKEFKIRQLKKVCDRKEIKITELNKLIKGLKHELKHTKDLAMDLSKDITDEAEKEHGWVKQ